MTEHMVKYFSINILMAIMIEMVATIAMMFVEMNEMENIEFPIVVMINGVEIERGNEDTMTDETVETKNEMIIEKVAGKKVEFEIVGRRILRRRRTTIST